MTRPVSPRPLVGLLVLLLAGPLQAQDPQRKPPAPPAPAGASRDDTKVEVELPAGPLEVSAIDLIRAGAQAVGGVLTVDPQTESVRLRLGLAAAGGPVTLTWGAIKTLLDFHDIVIVESQPTPDSPFVIRVHHRRNINQKEGPPWRVVPADAIPGHDELVTALFRIQHGAGNNIFGTVRGLLTRDCNRIGNILYVAGSEVIIVVDLAPKVRYYADVIAGLDVPNPSPVPCRAFKLLNADPQAVASAIGRLLGPAVAAAGEAPSPAQLGAPPVRVVADLRTGQVLVSGSEGALVECERIVAALDVKDAGRDLVLRVYPIETDDPTVVATARQFVARALQAMTNVGGSQRPEVFEGPTPRSLAVVARAADLPRVEEAIKAALGK